MACCWHLCLFSVCVVAKRLGGLQYLLQKRFRMMLEGMIQVCFNSSGFVACLRVGGWVVLTQVQKPRDSVMLAVAHSVVHGTVATCFQHHLNLCQLTSIAIKL